MFLNIDISISTTTRTKYVYWMLSGHAYFTHAYIYASYMYTYMYVVAGLASPGWEREGWKEGK